MTREKFMEHFRNQYERNTKRSQKPASKSQLKRKVKISEANYVENLYQSLNNREKYLVRKMVEISLTTGKNNSYSGECFNEIINRYNDDCNENISISRLANIILGYLEVSTRVEYDRTIKDPDYIKSKLSSLLQVYETDSECIIFKLACGYFCISPDVILIGKGVQYYIDYEELEKFIKKRNIDIEVFIHKHQELYLDKTQDNFVKYDKYVENYIDYIHHSAEEFAEIFACLYGVDKELILKKEPFSIQTDGFKTSYLKLSDVKRSEIKHILEELFTL